MLADGGYCDGRGPFETQTGLKNLGQWMRSLYRAMHEMVNGKQNYFKITLTKFRYSPGSQQMCFHAILVLTWIYIKKYYNEDSDLIIN